jgi:hypothetical protein
MNTIYNCAFGILRHATLAASCALGLAACQTTAGTDDVVRFFNDVAFRGSPGGHPMAGSALLETDFARHPLVRWENPITVQITGQPTGAHEDQVTKILNDFTRLTGVTHAWHQEGDGTANFVVDFEPDEGFLIHTVEYVPCFARSAHDNGRLTRVEIKISLQKPHLVPHCIPHELAHGFGFAHSNVLPSVVSPNERLRGFSRWDELTLKALYDDRLRAGMTRADALPIARKIIQEQLGGPH